MTAVVYAGFRFLASGNRSEMSAMRTEIVHRIDHLDCDVAFRMRKQFGDR